MKNKICIYILYIYIKYSNVIDKELYHINTAHIISKLYFTKLQYSRVDTCFLSKPISSSIKWEKEFMISKNSTTLKYVFA